MKQSKGKWVKVHVNSVCIGVGAQDEQYADYQQMICNSILPETDADYDLEREDIEADMTLISKAPEMYEALKDAKWIVENEVTSKSRDDLVKQIESLLKEIEK